MAVQALRLWGPRQVGVAAAATTAVGGTIGVATVLIPNPVFAREIAPVGWNYPAWVLTSLLTGLLVATYVQPGGARTGTGEETPRAQDTGTSTVGRSARVGVIGGLLAWFAVGCPVCNKIAILALGYTGAMTWFAPLQPVLAVVALAFSTLALIGRLSGQSACSVTATGVPA